MPKPNPLAAFTQVPAADFHLPNLPNLHEHIQARGLMEGAKAYHGEMEKWKQSAERKFIEQLNLIASKIPKSNAG